MGKPKLNKETKMLYKEILQRVKEIGKKRIWLHDKFIRNGILNDYYTTLCEMERQKYLKGYAHGTDPKPFIDEYNPCLDAAIQENNAQPQNVTTMWIRVRIRYEGYKLINRP